VDVLYYLYLSGTGKSSNPEEIVTNDHIPMANEEDNDQFSNNQMNGGKGTAGCLYQFFLVIGHCHYFR